jgi:hypothetical protein
MTVTLMRVPELNTIVREDVVEAMAVRSGDTCSLEPIAPGDEELAPWKPT